MENNNEQNIMQEMFIKFASIKFSKEEVKLLKVGGQEYKYISWAHAWHKCLSIYPAATYAMLPYDFSERLGYMVWTQITIGSITRKMWLPVLDGANKSMKHVPYEYKVKVWNEKTRKRDIEEIRICEAANMFDINTAMMRCLVKNLAMFGLGTYVYAGEDLPLVIIDDKQIEDNQSNIIIQEKKDILKNMINGFNYSDAWKSRVSELLENKSTTEVQLDVAIDYLMKEKEKQNDYN